jgi:hypothetical protein
VSRRVISLLFSIAACTTGGPVLGDPDAGRDASFDASTDAGFSCRPGELGCYGSVHYRCGPDGLSRLDETVCDAACDPARGCVVCVPNARRCTGTVSEVCEPDGSRWRFGRDCADWESSCGATGYCDDPCAEAERTRSNVGCEYWAVPLANTDELPFDVFDYRIVVANPNPAPVEVTVLRADRLTSRTTIVPGGVGEIVLPWIDGVSFPFEVNDWQSSVVEDGAYRVISSRPVIVSQFNPFHYSARGIFSYTNDASLLYPVHALGTEHFAVTVPPFSVASGTAGARYPGYIGIVATEDDTRVEIAASAYVAADAGGRWNATEPGGTIVLTMRRGEVAQIADDVPPLCSPDRPGYRRVRGEEGTAAFACNEVDYDLTGTEVRSSKPIALFGGHGCAYVPYDTPACDHLETQLAPVTTWGTRFETLPMRDPETSAPNFLRIVAARDDTTVAIQPSGANAVVLDRGEHVEIEIDGGVSIDASGPIQVAQLIAGQLVTDPPLERGDPALTALVPAEQFRRDYVFVTPSSYGPAFGGQSFVLISREPGTEIELDGDAVDPAWTTVGTRELAIVPVGGGVHRAETARGEPFGLIAFGLGSYTSYAYPAGLDLRVILE